MLTAGTVAARVLIAVRRFMNITFPFVWFDAGWVGFSSVETPYRLIRYNHRFGLVNGQPRLQDAVKRDRVKIFLILVLILAGTLAEKKIVQTKQTAIIGITMNLKNLGSPNCQCAAWLLLLAALLSASGVVPQ